jgi:pimeloyl-ACP methyl ester carboxylesterase
MPLLEFPVELVEVPYEATTLTGYLAHADESGRARPTLIHLGGYDGTAEEIFMALAAGTQRDYNVFTFDGPGQGGTLYEKRVVMRPDWENVVPPVVDLLIARPEVDPERVALMGRSFSGYLGVRPAAHDDRIAALLLDPGQYDIGRAIIERLPDGLRAKVHDSSQEVEAAFNELLGTERFRRLFLPRMATHGAQSVRRYVEMMLEYSNEGHAELVRCPTFVTDNESDQVSTGQGAILASHLKAPATFVTFTADMGAEGHCEGLGSVVFLERAFDWLDENIRRG